MLLVAASAVADPAKTDPNANVTVFTDADGAHVITLVKRGGQPDIVKVMNQKADGYAHGYWEIGFGAYFVRTRFVDGRLICEKFSIRPKREDEVSDYVAKLFAKSCS